MIMKGSGFMKGYWRYHAKNPSGSWPQLTTCRFPSSGIHPDTIH
jgi:hypothetical protein